MSTGDAEHTGAIPITGHTPIDPTLTAMRTDLTHTAPMPIGPITGAGGGGKT